jgi:hypothetical protein
MQDNDKIIIMYKFKPKNYRSKMAVKEIKKFLFNIEIGYEFDGVMPIKGDYVQFGIEDLIFSENYEEEFAKLSDDAKKYFKELCMDCPLKVHKRIFCGAIYLYLLAGECFIF